MNIFSVLITQAEIEELFARNLILSDDDRFRIQSFTFPTMLTQVGSDFNPFELDEFYRLESFNLKRLLTTAHIYFHDPIQCAIINSKPKMREYRSLSLKEFPEKKMQDATYFLMFMKRSLSNNDNSLKAEFMGKIPPKLFSMRQVRAETWYENYCSFVLRIAFKIFHNSSSENALLYIASNIAYYLNKSQSFKYYPKSGESLNDSIYRILIEFNQQDKQTEIAKLKENIPFYKDL
jgi:hypothetical protein